MLFVQKSEDLGKDLTFTISPLRSSDKIFVYSVWTSYKFPPTGPAVFGINAKCCTFDEEFNMFIVSGGPHRWELERAYPAGKEVEVKLLDGNSKKLVNICYDIIRK